MTDADLEQLVGSCTPDPLARGDGMTMKAFRAACQAERPRLLDPYLVDPEPFFGWVARPDAEAPVGTTLWLVEAVPRNNRPRTNLVFEAAREHYGLNRKSLEQLRGRVYGLLLDLKGILERINRAEKPDVWGLTANGLRTMMSARSPYAGMARYFVYDEWKLLERD
jgi:hypothetical protein